MLRATLWGARARAAELAWKVRRSFKLHSHSRFWRNWKLSGKVSVLSVVSIWKILTPASRISRPMRQLAVWSAEEGACMKDFECRIVAGLWWCRRLL